MALATACAVTYALLGPGAFAGEGLLESLLNAFRHADLSHLAVNAALLLAAGFIVERAVGSRLTLLVICVGLLAATGIEHAAAGGRFVGISGVAYSLIGAAVVIATSGKERLITLAALPLVVWLDAKLHSGPVAIFAHATGLVVGIAAGFLWQRTRGLAHV